MGRPKKEKVSNVKKVSNIKDEGITDVLETSFFDEQGNEKIKKQHMSGDKLVREEIVNA